MITADVNATKYEEFSEKVIQIRRVSKKTQGGNKIHFAAVAVVGNKNGKVGMGYGKATDVASAIGKAVGKAKTTLMPIKLKGTTIAHEVSAKYDSAKVLIMPATKGSGVIAGGPVRIVLEMAGVKDVSAKMYGANNKISNIKCTLMALRKLKG